MGAKKAAIARLRQEGKAEARRLRDQDRAADEMRDLLGRLGLPFSRETPGRFVRALVEMTAGYSMDPAEILAVRFDVECDEMVVVSGMPFTSLCAHHVLPIVGTATVGYLPRHGVVGLSKIPRLVECFARRLQVQEGMTREIAGAIKDHLEPLGVGVVVEARHQCMAARGVRSPGLMTTSSMLGAFRDQPEVRAEFLAAARRT